MQLKKLWTKLFHNNTETDEIALHVSGATVRHKNPFEELEVDRNKEELSEKFINKWVVPFYRVGIANIGPETIELFAKAAKEIDIEIVKKLLGDFNWRTRITGAFFAAINNYTALDDMIGKHLLKSEVCYAGGGYCLALTMFKTDKAIMYLNRYLDYYLDRTDLYFDQSDAFCALEWLDKSLAQKMLPKLDSFVVSREYFNLEESRKYFESSMTVLNKIRSLIA